MIHITINNKAIQVKEGTTVLAAASELGFSIPTLCWREELKPSTSCMVCLVKNRKNNTFIPSCSSMVEEGMEIETNTDEVLNLRKKALELLLSEHMGDCEAPCQRSCPANMDIPGMNRLISEEKFAESNALVRETIPLPAVLGYICPAPCERACRRKDIDAPVSICLLKRFVGANFLRSSAPITVNITENAKKVAIVGAGPAGLTAAFYLARAGHSCVLFDENQLPGGALRYQIAKEKLPESVLDAEIKMMSDMGLLFRMNRKVDRAVLEEEIAPEVDSIIWCAGEFLLHDSGEGIAKELYANATIGVIERANKKVFMHVPQRGNNPMAVRAVAQGRRLAEAVLHNFSEGRIMREEKAFNSTYFRIAPDEYEVFLSESRNKDKAVVPTDKDGYLAREAVLEASRCLHCDCRKKDNCGLRDLSTQHKVKGRQFSLKKRKIVQKEWQHALVVYEDNKCIKCGICIQLTRQVEHIPGVTFVGRGFDVQVKGALGAGWDKALGDAAAACAEQCPTGAIAYKNTMSDDTNES